MKYYCIFYKNRGKWTGPLRGELLTMKDIIYSSGLKNENAPQYEHVKNYLKEARKWLKKPTKLMKQVYKDI